MDGAEIVPVRRPERQRGAVLVFPLIMRPEPTELPLEALLRWRVLRWVLVLLELVEPLLMELPLMPSCETPPTHGALRAMEPPVVRACAPAHIGEMVATAAARQAIFMYALSEVNRRPSITVAPSF